MLKIKERKKRKKLKIFLEEEKPSNNFNISSGMLLPKGFSTETDDQTFSLFYRKKRFATFLATKVTEKKIKEAIKEFQLNKHKYHR
jgi:hypothetical protein